MAPFTFAVFDDMLAKMGGHDAFCKKLDRERGWPPGCASKMFSLSQSYEYALKLYMIVHQDASKNDLRHKILPPLVEQTYKDWSPQKQEYLVWAGVQIWFDERRRSPKKEDDEDWAWSGFHDYCTKWVNKQGFLSGPGDRELFGWSIEEGDMWGSADETVHWSDDDQVEEVDETVEHDEQNGDNGDQQKRTVITELDNNVSQPTEEPRCVDICCQCGN
jgi:hypothetical protein